MADITQIHGDEEERLDANDSGIFTWHLRTGIMQTNVSSSSYFPSLASTFLRLIGDFLDRLFYLSFCHVFLPGFVFDIVIRPVVTRARS